MYILLVLFLMRTLTNTASDLPCGANVYKLLPRRPAWCLAYRVPVPQLIRKPIYWARDFCKFGGSQEERTSPPNIATYTTG